MQLCIFVCVCVPGVYASQAGWGQTAVLIIMSVWIIDVRMEPSVSTIWTATVVFVRRDTGAGNLKKQ